MSAEVQTPAAEAAPPPPPTEVVDIDADTVEARPPQPKPAAKPKGQSPTVPTPRVTSTFDQMQRQEEAELRAFLEGLAGGAPVKIKVTRKRPEKTRLPNGRLFDCSGYLNEHDEIIDEAFLAETYGGGTYMIQLMMQDTRGSWVYKKSRNVKIPGDPKVDEMILNDEPTASGAAPAATGESASQKKLVEILEKQVDKAEEKARSAGGIDPALVALISKPFEAQLEMMKLQLQAAEARATAATTAASQPSLEEKANGKILDKLLDGDMARLEAVRLQYQSELQQLRTAMVETEKRLRDQFERDAARAEAAHTREIQNMKALHDMALASVSGGNNVQVETLKGRLAALEREITKLEVENKELRDKKEKSPVELLKDAASLKDLIADLNGGDDEKEEKGKIAQVLEGLGLKEVAAALAGRLAAAGQEQVQQGGIPNGVQFLGQDGRYYLQTANGPVQLRQLPKKKSKGQAAAGGAPAAGAPTTEGGEEQVASDKPPRISHEHLSMVVPFLESGFQNNQEPATLAQSAKAIAPGQIPGIVQAITRHGVDDFLDQVAAFKGDSPLAQQSGRNYLRKVARALVGDI